MRPRIVIAPGGGYLGFALAVIGLAALTERTDMLPVRLELGGGVWLAMRFPSIAVCCLLAFWGPLRAIAVAAGSAKKTRKIRDHHSANFCH